MQSLSVEQMREADRRAIEVLGIPSKALMERAGLGVFQHVPSGPVVVVCGKGNNGGDGFVVARYSLLAGNETTVIVLALDDQLSKDALIFKKVYTRLGGICLVALNEDDLRSVFDKQNTDAVWVDAMLGTGTRSDVAGIVRVAIDHWPQVHTVSIDIPSGLNADTGEACGAAIVATETVTLQYPKMGFEIDDAMPFLGEVHVVDIGIPAICADEDAWNRLKVE